MSESDIITKEAVADTLNKLTTQQESVIDSIIKELTAIKESKRVSETNLRTLSSAWRELDALRESFFIKLLNSMKRGNMILN
jgi:hypothetical protein